MLRRRAGRPCVVTPVGDRLRLLIGDRHLEVPARIAGAVDVVRERTHVDPCRPGARRRRATWCWPAASSGKACSRSGPEVGVTFRCSAAALDRGDSIAGTASTVRSFLLVENPGPWGVDAVRDSRLPAGGEGRAAGRRGPGQGAPAADPALPPPGSPHGLPGVRRPGRPRRELAADRRARPCRGPARPRPRRPGRGPVARAGADRRARSSASAPTASTTPAAPRRAGRSRRRSRRPTPRRPGRSPTSAATASRATPWCCPTASTSAGSTPSRPSPRPPTCSAGGCPSTCCAAGRACRWRRRQPRSRCSATSTRPRWPPSACCGSGAPAT